MKGQKTGGRQKGTPNIRSVFLVQTACEKFKCNPFEVMARLATDKESTRELQGKMASELGQYLAAKRKAVEHSGPGGEPIGVSVSATDEFTRRIISLATRLRAGGADPKPD